MIDFSTVKSITIPEGIVKQISIDDIILWKGGITNLVPTSIDTDGSIFNGTGYKNGSRLNSSAAVVDLAVHTVTGYIPAKAGDIIRVKGVAFDSNHHSGCYFWTFDSNFTRLKAERPADTNTEDISVTYEENGVIAFRLVNYNTSVRYIRFSAFGDGANAIVTVNEEITSTFTNLASMSTTDPGGTEIYNNMGWIDGMRWSSSGGSAVSQSEARLTGWMSFTPGATIRVKNFGLTTSSGYVGGCYFVWYKSDGTTSTVQAGVQSVDEYTYIAPNDSSILYFRISGYAYYNSTQSSPVPMPPIVTINEEITE